MGADRWSVCWKCEDADNNELGELKARRNSQYGKIPKEEYDLLQTKIDELEARLDNPKEQLREDWEVTSGGNLGFYYSCHCYRCGYNFKIEKLWLAKDIEEGEKLEPIVDANGDRIKK
jgi:hypothetical protein